MGSNDFTSGDVSTPSPIWIRLCNVIPTLNTCQSSDQLDFGCFFFFCLPTYHRPSRDERHYWNNAWCWRQRRRWPSWPIRRARAGWRRAAAAAARIRMSWQRLTDDDDVTVIAHGLHAADNRGPDVGVLRAVDDQRTARHIDSCTTYRAAENWKIFACSVVGRLSNCFAGRVSSTHKSYRHLDERHRVPPTRVVSPLSAVRCTESDLSSESALLSILYVFILLYIDT